MILLSFSGRLSARGLEDEAIEKEPRSFSPLFNVAASRPAQMTTDEQAF
jgi:hypothetical protein